MAEYERGIWCNVFKENNYDIDSLLEMDHDSFQRLVNFFLDSGFNPDRNPPKEFYKALNKRNSQFIEYRSDNDLQEIYSSQNNSQHASLKYGFKFSSKENSNEPSALSLITQDQNEQYAMLLSEMQEQERLSLKHKEDEERKIREELAQKRSNLNNAKNKILENASNLPKEPKNASDPDVVSVSVVLPSGKRILRRFLASEPASHVYDWVSSFGELFDPLDESLLIDKPEDDEKMEDDKEKEQFVVDLIKNISNLGMPRHFYLIQLPNLVFSREKTIGEQKIGKRALFNIFLEE